LGLSEKKVPKNAFLLSPKNGYWEGLLTMGNEYTIRTDDNSYKEYLIYLYKVDENNQNNYLKMIDANWKNIIYF
jgi:hypothetical protein